MLRKLATVGAVTVALLVPANAAFADNCFNASRPSGGLSTNPADFSAPVIRGNWVWLPSVGVPAPSWGFEPPYNFQDRQGTEDWLLAKTPYCAAGGFVNPGGTSRTYTHGIQSGCGAFG